MKSATENLSEQILLLKSKQAHELRLLKEHFHLIHEELKPINLIKNAFKEVAASPDLKNNILDNVIGLATGYLSRKVLIGSSHNPLKKVIGTVLQFAIANVVSKHSDGIKTVGENVIEKILKLKNKFLSSH